VDECKPLYMGDKPGAQMIRVDKKSMIEEIQEADEEPSFPLRPRKMEPRPVPKPAAGKGGKAAAAAAGAGAGAMGSGAKGAAMSALSGAMASKAKISEVGGSEEGEVEAGVGASTSGGAAAFSFGKLPEVEHSVEFIGRPVTDVAVHIPLPVGVSVSQVRVCIVMEGVTVDMPGHQALRVELPFAVDGDAAVAECDGNMAGPSQV